MDHISKLQTSLRIVNQYLIRTTVKHAPKSVFEEKNGEEDKKSKIQKKSSGMCGFLSKMQYIEMTICTRAKQIHKTELT